MKNNTKTPTITARARHVLTTPRKANLILASLPGEKALTALARLELLPHKAAAIVAKVLKQAIGNATSAKSLSPEALTIDTAYATKGRTLKRAHFGGRGHVKPYERTAAHITINLRGPIATSVNTKPKAVAAPKATTPIPVKTIKKVNTKPTK